MHAQHSLTPSPPFSSTGAGASEPSSSPAQSLGRRAVLGGGVLGAAAAAGAGGAQAEEERRGEVSSW